MIKKKPYEKPMLINLTEKQVGLGDCAYGYGDEGSCAADGNIANVDCYSNGNTANELCESAGSDAGW